MFHSQMNTKLLQDKMNAIIMCYFQSQTPPRVQVGGEGLTLTCWIILGSYLHVLIRSIYRIKLLEKQSRNNLDRMYSESHK